MSQSMPEAPETLAISQAEERRLHPLSWFFVLIQQLKQFIVPLLVLLFLGRGDRNDLWSIVFICLLATYSIWQYYTYRFRIDRDSLTIRSGLLERSLRQIPFARIHNVALHQSLLHRLFRVADVRRWKRWYVVGVRRRPVWSRRMRRRLRAKTAKCWCVCRSRK
jgi:putative membrane protein